MGGSGAGGLQAGSHSRGMWSAKWDKHDEPRATEEVKGDLAGEWVVQDSPTSAHVEDIFRGHVPPPEGQLPEAGMLYLSPRYPQSQKQRLATVGTARTNAEGMSAPIT